MQATEKLGIADRVKKMPVESGEAVGQAVVRGDATYGILPLSEILPVKGAVALGPFPPDVRTYVVMVAGVSSASTNAKAAKTLVDFITAPAANATIVRHGMERGGS